MNDRYLYRAKRKKWREIPKEKWWVEGYYAYMKPYHCIMPKDKFDSWIGIDEKTLCQCTGLKDKNGKLIWENDIVRIVYNGIEYIYKVIWDVSELDFKATNGKENYKSNFQYLTCCEEIEIIENIFDNPELLEVEE